MTEPSADELQVKLDKSEATSEGRRTQIAALEARQVALLEQVEGLEAMVAGLEAEGLKPLVERLRSQIASIKKLVVAMAVAVGELTEQASVSQ